MPLTNDQMIAGRFLRIHKARRRVAWIKSQLAAGRTILICTMTKATAYKAKHIDMFKATKTGAYVQSGNKWLCIDFTKIVAQ